MKNPSFLREHFPSLDFRSYAKPIHPPLDTSQLSLRALIGEERKSLCMPVEGDASLLLSYKGEKGAVLSIAERANGEEWNIPQVQGAHSDKSYRVHRGVHWQRCFADHIRACVEQPHSPVKHLTMPHWSEITNLTDARNFENARKSYEFVRHALEMTYSDTLHCYIVDVRKNAARAIA